MSRVARFLFLLLLTAALIDGGLGEYGTGYGLYWVITHAAGNGGAGVAEAIAALYLHWLLFLPAVVIGYATWQSRPWGNVQ